MTQSQLSALLSERGLEIDPSGIARIERGERSPRLNEAFAIADALAGRRGGLMGMVAPDRPPRTRAETAENVRQLNESLARIDQRLRDVEVDEGRARRAAAELRRMRAEILADLADHGAIPGKRPWSDP